jgi:hypothetical protein
MRCEKCKQDPAGERGHAGMRAAPGASYPGHAAFQCGECGERWLRHGGIANRLSWTRHDLQFGGGPRPELALVVPSRATGRTFW